MLLCSCLESNCLAGCVFVIADYPDRMEHSILNTWLEVKIFFMYTYTLEKIIFKYSLIKRSSHAFHVHLHCTVHVCLGGEGEGEGEGGGVGVGALSHVVHTGSLNRVWILDLSVLNKVNNCTQICPKQRLNLS